MERRGASTVVPSEVLHYGTHGCAQDVTGGGRRRDAPLSHARRTPRETALKSRSTTSACVVRHAPNAKPLVKGTIGCTVRRQLGKLSLEDSGNRGELACTRGYWSNYKHP